MTANKKITFVIDWDDNEKLKFKDLIKDIRTRSNSLADYIKDEISDRLEKIKKYPELFEIDAMKTENNGNYRKFNVIHIRVVYKIEKKRKRILIVRIRHSASEPSEY